MGPTIDRMRLEALRYAVNEEAAHYIGVMRVFTGGTAGLLPDLSAVEVAAWLTGQGLELAVDTVDARLSYLVEHGNLARSPRETEARSIREYLTNRARYQLTQRGELVHRQVEDLLGATDAAREVSSEMLGGLLAGLRDLNCYDTSGWPRTTPARRAAGRERSAALPRRPRLARRGHRQPAGRPVRGVALADDRGRLRGGRPTRRRAAADRPAEPSWDADLGAAMRRLGMAVHEEQVVADLLTGWSP